MKYSQRGRKIGSQAKLVIPGKSRSGQMSGAGRRRSGVWVGQDRADGGDQGRARSDTCPDLLLATCHRPLSIPVSVYSPTWILLHPLPLNFPVWILHYPTAPPHQYPKSSFSCFPIVLLTKFMLAFSRAMLVEGPGDPSVSDWSLLVFGVVAGTPCLSGLCLCVFIYCFLHTLLCKKWWLANISEVNALTFHVHL